MTQLPASIIFIHGNDPESRTRARQHVSRIVRGREKIAYLKSSRTRQATSLIKDEPRAKRRRGRRNSVHQDDTYAPTDRRTANGTAATVTGTKELVLLRPIPIAIISRGLSATPSDPFGTLPVRMSALAAKLLYHYVKVMPSIEFGINGDAPTVPPRDLAFRSAMETPCSLNTIIAIAGVQWANLNRRAKPWIVSYHLSQSLQQLREGLDCLNADNWRTFVQPLLELVACDELRGEHKSLKAHVVGLRNLLEQYGGLGKLYGLPRVQVLACYVFHGSAVSYFEQIRPTLPLSDKDLIRENNTTTEVYFEKLSAQQMTDVHNHVNQYCMFMAQLDEMRISGDPMFDLIHHYFRPGTKLAKSLCVLGTVDDDKSCLGQINLHHIAMLFLITHELVAIIDAKDRLALELFLEKMCLLYRPSVRLFKINMMQGGAYVDFYAPARNWDVVRLLQVWKLLPLEWRSKTGKGLLEFLQGDQMRHCEESKAMDAEINIRDSGKMLGPALAGLMKESEALQSETLHASY